MDTCILCGKEIKAEEEKEKYFGKLAHNKCYKLNSQNPRSRMRWRAIDKTKELEAEGMKKYFISKGCRVDLEPFIDIWYGRFGKFMKDTADDIWKRFIDSYYQHQLPRTNRARVFFERPNARKNVNRPTRLLLENHILLKCDIYPCYECMNYTILLYQRYATAMEKRKAEEKGKRLIVYAKCLKCGIVYKNNKVEEVKG